MRENVKGRLRFCGALFTLAVLTVGIQTSVNRLYAYQRIGRLMANVPTLSASEKDELERLLLDYTGAPVLRQQFARPHANVSAAANDPDDQRATAPRNSEVATARERILPTSRPGSSQQSHRELHGKSHPPTSAAPGPFEEGRPCQRSP